MRAFQRLVFGVVFAGCCVAGGAWGLVSHAAPQPDQGVGAPPAPAAPGAETGNPEDANGPLLPAPPEVISERPRVERSLMEANFAYPAANMLDPFVSFIAPTKKTPSGATMGEEGESDLPPEMQRPLTPLQKMGVGEIEGGLKAIVWGDLGRRAVIEDSAGKGYIVNVGTPVGEKNGVVSQIFNDSLVIQQEIWDAQLKRMIPQNVIVKLKKKQQQ